MLSIPVYMSYCILLMDVFFTFQDWKHSYKSKLEHKKPRRNPAVGTTQREVTVLKIVPANGVVGLFLMDQSEQ